VSVESPLADLFALECRRTVVKRQEDIVLVASVDFTSSCRPTMFVCPPVFELLPSEGAHLDDVLSLSGI
jgi:hypothetical protein